MVYFIFDNPQDKSKMEFLDSCETKEYRQVYPDHRLLGAKEMVLFLRGILSKTNRDDTLIFWYDFMGILCWWICRLTLRKRSIIILNILLKDKKSLRNKLAKVLYRGVLSDLNVKVTVTSEEYGQWLNSLLGLDRRYFLLHDIYYGDASDGETGCGGYVFCGGRNGRDWNKLIHIAKLMPDVDFKCVMPGALRDSIDDIVCNAEILCDISEKDFLRILSGAALVALPLDTDAPAGLIVLFQAGMYKKLVITSDTPVTREYITKDSGVLCTSDDEWCASIRFYMNNAEECRQKAERFNLDLNEKCAKEKYARKLIEVVEGE